MDPRAISTDMLKPSYSAVVEANSDEARSVEDRQIGACVEGGLQRNSL